MIDFKLINGTTNYFIYKDGYVFKTKNAKDYILPINIIQGYPKVLIMNERKNLVLLMIEYWSDKKIENDKYNYSFKIVNNRVPLKHIKIKYYGDLNDDDQRLIIKYKCNIKASSQNSRVNNIQKITEIDVLNSLKRTNFRCTYCNTGIKPNSWHLDHVQPLSESGQNTPNNITPSCKYCNLMKGAIPLEKFLHQIKLISINYNF